MWRGLALLPRGRDRLLSDQIEGDNERRRVALEGLPERWVFPGNDGERNYEANVIDSRNRGKERLRLKVAEECCLVRILQPKGASVAVRCLRRVVSIGTVLLEEQRRSSRSCVVRRWDGRASRSAGKDEGEEDEAEGSRRWARIDGEC